MKTILAAMIVGLSFIGSSTASAQSLEEILGAVAGYQLGNSIGDGDGRRAARVIGAIIGYRMGERVLSEHDHREFRRLGHNDFRRWCRHQVPYRYERDSRLRNQWVSGCVSRLNRQQRQLEREAYEDGLYGSSN